MKIEDITEQMMKETEAKYRKLCGGRDAVLHQARVKYAEGYRRIDDTTTFGSLMKEIYAGRPADFSDFVSQQYAKHEHDIARSAYALRTELNVRRKMRLPDAEIQKLTVYFIFYIVWKGTRSEAAAIAYFRSRGFQVITTAAADDIAGIDLLLYRDGRLCAGIQVKGAAYAEQLERHTEGTQMRTDHADLLKKMTDWSAKRGVPAYICCFSAEKMTSFLPVRAQRRAAA